MVCEADGRVVAEDFDGFLQAAGEVEGGPVVEVCGEGGEVHDAVFDHDAVDGDVGVEVDARAEGVLDCRDRGGAVGEVAQGGVVVWMLGEVERVPVLRVADAEDEVDDFRAAFLPFFYRFWGVGVGTQTLGI